MATSTPQRHDGRSRFILPTMSWSSDMKMQSFAIPAASTIATTRSSSRWSWPYDFSSTTTRALPLHTASASASVGTRSPENCGPMRLPMSTVRSSAAVVLPDLHRRAAHLHQVAVVDDQHLAVGRLLHVELDEVGALLGGQAKGGQRVLGRRGRRAAVGDDQHRLVAPRDQEREQCEADERRGRRSPRCRPSPARGDPERAAPRASQARRLWHARAPAARRRAGRAGRRPARTARR